MGALGVVAVGGAVYYGLHARSLDHDLSNPGGGWPADLDAKIQEGKDSERNAIILGIAGGVAVATGVTLYILGARATVTPVTDGRTAGVAVTGVW